MDVFGKGIGGFSEELARMSHLTSPKWLTELEKTAKAISGVSEMTRIWEKQVALTRALGGSSAILVEQAALSDKLFGSYKTSSMFETSLKASQLLSGAAIELFGLTGWHRLQSSLGGVVSVDKLTEQALGLASKHSLIRGSVFGRGSFQDWDSGFDSLRAVAASVQGVEWMKPLIPAMLSLTELAEEDRLAKLRSIIASLLASVPRHLNFDRLLAILGLILALLPNGQVEELSEHMKAEFRQLSEEIRENRVAADLDAEQLRELQIRVLLATEGIHSDYVATIETTIRIKTRRSGRAFVIGTLSPGEPVIVLLLRGRWAYVEAELETRHVVGWIPKKALSRPRRALLPDLAGAAGAPNEEGVVDMRKLEWLQGEAFAT